MKELITVIIPTYKRSSTLKRAIISVLEQTYKNIEIIVVDDNVNYPECRKQVKDIVSEFNNVKLILNKTNLGGGGSRNEGIKKANGKYIAFLDDDDEFFKEKIEKQYKLFLKKNKETKTGLIYCYADYVGKNKTYTVKNDNEGCPIKEHAITCICATSWWFCPKNVLEEIGGFENVSSHQDAITLLKILEKGYNIYRVPEVLLKYYLPDGKGITKINQEWINVDIKYRDICRNLKLSKSDMKEIEYSFSKRICNMAIIINNKSLALKELKNMIKLYPFNKETFKMIIKKIFRPIYLLNIDRKNKKK